VERKNCVSHAHIATESIAENTGFQKVMVVQEFIRPVKMQKEKFPVLSE
jgi:hypothetical protein